MNVYGTYLLIKANNVMKKIILSVSFFLFSGIFVFAQTGKVFDNLSFSSSILKSERLYAIYLPPDYDISQRSYPVLYLLHGAGDNQTGWIQFGEVQLIADEAIKSGKATPMIIVMPDANTGKRGYFNDIQGQWLYEDFFFKEFIPYIEKTYRTRTERRYRAVAGLSMGGGGTFMYALHHPELFCCACPLSAYIGELSIEDFKKRNQENINKLSDSSIQKYYDYHNALSLMNTLAPQDIKSVRWYIDCGDDDFLYEGNSLIHIAMRKRELPHEFRIRDGQHNWVYWRESLPAVLEFITKSFH